MFPRGDDLGADQQPVGICFHRVEMPRPAAGTLTELNFLTALATRHQTSTPESTAARFPEGDGRGESS